MRNEIKDRTKQGNHILAEAVIVNIDCDPAGGRILGLTWDKSLKSFPPFYSQLPKTVFTPSPPPPQLFLVIQNIFFGTVHGKSGKRKIVP
jgi:hypothetical protein